MTQWLLLMVAAPFLLAFVVMCLRDPMRVALPIFAAVIPFGGALSLGSSPFGSLSSLAGVLLAGGLVLQLITTRRLVPNLSPTIPVWLLFLGTAGASFLWTIDRPTTTRGLVVLASLVLVYVLVATAPVDRDVVRRTENGLLVGGVAVVGYGLYQLFVLGGFPDADPQAAGPAEDGRFGNDLLGPGVQAVSLLLPLVIALSRSFSQAGRGSRVVHAVIAALMLCGVLMTGSRTGTLAAGLALITLVWSSPPRFRKGMLIACAVGLVTAGLVWVFNPAGVASRSFESPTSSSGRTDIWQVGLAACPDYCGIGAGWGAYPEVYAQTQASVADARVLVGEDGSYQPHNLWLLAGVELGVLGLVLLALGLGFSFVEAQRLPRELRGPPLSGLVGLLAAVFFLSSMEFKTFWMALIVVALYRNMVDAESRAYEPTHRLGSYPSARTSQ
ncbi:MAG TPA: O-antigen ligase family protein [Nocardioidaceae bacterium]|nr:O-antigen ligase family protein [Nocardioidaceae bacterium]